jgi:hypothetical protein
MPTPAPTPTTTGYTFQDPGQCNCCDPVPCSPCDLPCTTETMTGSYSGGSMTLAWNAGASEWQGSVGVGGGVFYGMQIGCAGGNIEAHLSQNIPGATCGLSTAKLTSFTCSPLSLTFDSSACGAALTAFFGGSVTFTQP